MAIESSFSNFSVNNSFVTRTSNTAIDRIGNASSNSIVNTNSVDNSNFANNTSTGIESDRAFADREPVDLNDETFNTTGSSITSQFERSNTNLFTAPASRSRFSGISSFGSSNFSNSFGATDFGTTDFGTANTSFNGFDNRTPNTNFVRGSGSSSGGLGIPDTDISLVQDLGFNNNSLSSNVENNFPFTSFVDTPDLTNTPNNPSNTTNNGNQVGNQVGVNDTTNSGSNGLIFSDFIDDVFSNGLDSNELNSGNSGSFNQPGNAIINSGDGLTNGALNPENADSTLIPNRILGSRGEVRFTGSSNDDRLRGGRRKDVLIGLDGNDWIAGGRGNDALRGDVGDDRLWGRRGNDILYDDRGNDRLNGNQGSDLLAGGIGNNILSGGRGSDIFVLNDRGKAIIQDFNIRRDRLMIPDTINSSSVGISQQNDDAIVQSNNATLAILKNVQASDLSTNNFMTNTL